MSHDWTKVAYKYIIRVSNKPGILESPGKHLELRFYTWKVLENAVDPENPGKWEKSPGKLPKTWNLDFFDLKKPGIWITNFM